MKNWIAALLLAGLGLQAQEPTQRETFIRDLYGSALSDQLGYEWLRQLTSIGGRLAGSAQADSAVAHFARLGAELGYEVYTQEVRVPKWTRGSSDSLYLIQSNGKKIGLRACALGGSVATTSRGLQAPLVEVYDLNALDSIDVRGKVVYFSKPMEANVINAFHAYSQTVNIRWSGAVEASKRGAVGMIMRSLSSTVNPYPHTGSMTYEGAEVKIPAAAISTQDAVELEDLLRHSKTEVFMQLGGVWQDSVSSHNLILEWPAEEETNTYIVLGGHLDSWDLAEGAHDDGTGCMHALEAVELLRRAGYKSQHNIRVVFFMNEEFGLNGARTYAQQAEEKQERHILAMESDAGGFLPRGFGIEAKDDLLQEIKNLRCYLEPYGLHEFGKGGGGADINQLKDEGIVLIGLRPDSNRYFDYHHASTDVFEAVHPREFAMGSASMAALLYLILEEGIVK